VSGYKSNLIGHPTEMISAMTSDIVSNGITSLEPPCQLPTAPTATPGPTNPFVAITVDPRVFWLAQESKP